MIENVSTQLTVFHCFAHCLLPGRAFASLYALLFLEKEAEIGGRVSRMEKQTVFAGKKLVSPKFHLLKTILSANEKLPLSIKSSVFWKNIK